MNELCEKAYQGHLKAMESTDLVVEIALISKAI